MDRKPASSGCNMVSRRHRFCCRLSFGVSAVGDYNSLLQVKRFIVLLAWLDSSNCEGFSILGFALDSNSQHVRTSTKS